MQYDDIAFQRAILANPEDVTLKLVYADWLQDRGDPRAEYVQRQVDLGRPRNKTPRGQARERFVKNQHLRDLGRGLDPVWVAFMNTLAQPFAPMTFQDGEPGHPFAEVVGKRGDLVVFESQYRSGDDWDSGLLSGFLKDVEFVVNSDWLECAYGAASCPLYGFVCDLPANRDPLSARDVLSAIKAADFQSEHIADLNATAIPFPGYHPLTVNDEIHTEFAEQHMFDTRTSGEGDVEDNATHGLKGYVSGGRLWYVLLHIGGRPCWMVTLLAVGQSPHGNRLVGAITSQMCHNLCD